MAVLNFVAGNGTVAGFNQLANQITSILNVPNSVVALESTVFVYSFSALNGTLVTVSGTGSNLTYGVNNNLTGGTITGLTYLERSFIVPASDESYTLTDLNISVADFQSGNWASSALIGDDTALVNIGNGIFASAERTVETGAGADTVTVDNAIALNVAAFAGTTTTVDLGAGGDTLNIPLTGFDQTITLGAGADTIKLGNQVGTGAAQTPNRTVVDFNPAEDRIELETFVSDGITPAREWGIAATPSRVVITSSNADGSDSRDHLTLLGVDASSVSLTGNILAGIPLAQQNGTAGDDVLIGTPAPDLIFGFGGNDVIVGRTANDVLIGGDGNDAVFGGDGRDFIYGNEGVDGLFAGSGNDVVFGGSGNDYIEGTSGFNELFGQDGNDQILGGSEVDVIQGNAGDDVIAGGAGNDVLQGGDGNDTIDGGLGNDSIDGGAGNDTLDGQDGNDTLFGGDGNDGLSGGAGDDTIFGGDGSDSIRGGAGLDILEGEGGGDLFSFGVADDFNFVTDFQDGVDLLAFTGDATTSAPQIFATLDGTGTWIGFGQTQIILEGVSSTLIDNNDFVVALPSVTNQPAAALALADEVDAA